MPPAERRVVETVRELGIDLDLEHLPDIRERLVELGTHFNDSVDIARLIRANFAELRQAAGLTTERPEYLMRAGLLHDIGKSGPPGERGEFHAAIRRLFEVPAKPFKPFDGGRAKTIAEFMHENGMADEEALTETLAAHGVDAQHEAAISFWRRHAEWTLSVLEEESEGALDEETVRIAASHHLLEGQNPAEINFGELVADPAAHEFLAQCELLAATDKYQAFRQRGGLEHASAIAALRKMANDAKNYPAVLRDKFLAVVDVLDKAQAANDALLG